MALALVDRVKETATANTTVSFNLLGAIQGYLAFDWVGNTNSTWYCAEDDLGNWEVGYGTYTSAPELLTRDTIDSSSAGGLRITFPGSLRVFITYPATRAVTSDGDQVITNKDISATDNIITTAVSGNLTSTNLNAALAELQGDIDTRTTTTTFNAHLNDTVDAHDASAISSVASGNLVATDVQSALNELQTDVDTRATSSSVTSSLALKANLASPTFTGTVTAPTIDATVSLNANNIYITDGTDSLVFGNSNDYRTWYNGTSNKMQFEMEVTCLGIQFTDNGTERAYLDKNGNFSINGAAKGVITTDNDGSFNLATTNNFKCTPTGTFTLTFTNHTAGQSGYVLLINTGGHAISAAATTKLGASTLATISVAGTYLLSYLDDGTNSYVTASGAMA